jgi:hypothetical protein
MAKRKRKKKSSGDLGTENELMKLKMMAEFGGNFMGSEDIPPEVENEFLKQIISFHKQHENSALTSVYKYIGEPEYNHVKDMGDPEVDRELKRLMKLMEKNGVSLSVLAETPKREIYRFVTEELFKHQIEDVKVKGWVNQFVYEEFYPNQDYDVRNAVLYCLQSIFNKGHMFFEDHYSEEMKNALNLTIDAEEFKEQIESFWNRFNNIKLDQYDLVKLEIDKENRVARVICNLSYKTQTEKRKKFKLEHTTAEIALELSKYMDSWWEIKQVICDAIK